MATGAVTVFGGAKSEKAPGAGVVTAPRPRPGDTGAGEAPPPNDKPNAGAVVPEPGVDNPKAGAPNPPPNREVPDAAALSSARLRAPRSGAPDAGRFSLGVGLAGVAVAAVLGAPKLAADELPNSEDDDAAAPVAAWKEPKEAMPPKALVAGAEAAAVNAGADAADAGAVAPKLSVPNAGADADVLGVAVAAVVAAVAVPSKREGLEEGMEGHAKAGADAAAPDAAPNPIEAELPAAALLEPKTDMEPRAKEGPLLLGVVLPNKGAAGDAAPKAGADEAPPNRVADGMPPVGRAGMPNDWAADPLDAPDVDREKLGPVVAWKPKADAGTEVAALAPGAAAGIIACRLPCPTGCPGADVTSSSSLSPSSSSAPVICVAVCD